MFYHAQPADFLVGRSHGARTSCPDKISSSQKALLCWSCGRFLPQQLSFLEWTFYVASTGPVVPRLDSWLLPSPFPVVPVFFRRVPPRSDLANSCWKAHWWLVRAVHEDGSSLVTICGHKRCSGRWKTTPLLPAVQASCLRKPTIGPACCLFPSPAQVLPVVVPFSCATLVVCR